MNRYDPKRRTAASSEDGRYRACGAPPNPRAADYFVSSPHVSRSGVVDLKPGTLLVDERFTIKRRLGQGTFGTVYLAHDGIRGEDVALKVVELGPESSDLAFHQLQRELILHARITDYQHVIRVHDIHQMAWGGITLMILSMEYADGGTLRQWLLDHKSDLASRRSEGMMWFTQACAGVVALHAAGIFPLDLKPENLLFCGQIVKVADFGVARAASTFQMADSAQEELKPSDLGTPAYMSPEQAVAACWDDLDERADIYPLGVILYELLHPECRRPFVGSAERLRARHLDIPPRRLPGATPIEARVISRCLAPNPDDRYSTVGELLNDLEGRQDPIGGETIAEETDGEEVEHLWDQVGRCMVQGDLGTATRLCQRLLEACPGHGEARRLLEELQARYRQAEQFYAVIDRELDHRALDESVSLIREAIEIYPEHPTGHLVQTRLATRAREYGDRMQEGVQYLQQGLWDAALSCFRRVQQLNADAPGLTRAIELIHEVQQQTLSLRGYIDDAIRQGNRRRAMSLARALDEYAADVRLSIQSECGGPQSCAYQPQ